MPQKLMWLAEQLQSCGLSRAEVAKSLSTRVGYEITLETLDKMVDGRRRTRSLEREALAQIFSHQETGAAPLTPQRRSVRPDPPASGMAERLRKARLEAGYASIAEVLKAFAWSAPTYRAHELGHKAIRTGLAIRYAKAFGVDPAWLIYGDKGLNRAQPQDGLAKRKELRDLLTPALVAVFEALNTKANPQALADRVLCAIEEAANGDPGADPRATVAQLARAAVESLSHGPSDTI